MVSKKDKLFQELGAIVFLRANSKLPDSFASEKREAELTAEIAEIENRKRVRVMTQAEECRSDLGTLGLAHSNFTSCPSNTPQRDKQDEALQVELINLAFGQQAEELANRLIKAPSQIRDGQL